MSIFVVPTYTDEPNDWVALDPRTYALIDRAETLNELIEKVGGGLLFTRAWTRPRPI